MYEDVNKDPSPEEWREMTRADQVKHVMWWEKEGRHSANKVDGVSKPQPQLHNCDRIGHVFRPWRSANIGVHQQRKCKVCNFIHQIDV